MSRPSHLSDYDSPPINEVSLGVQFATPSGYQQIYAGEVWKLFKEQFPKVKEMEPLPPTFETFGLPQRAQVNFGIITGPSHDRFWFLSENEDQLIQFQSDRFLHNWRKIGEGKNPYPRFDEIIVSYKNELAALENFFASNKNFGGSKLSINQCELTYFNHIPLDEDGKKVDQWLALAQLEAIDPDDFSLGYRKVLTSNEGKPYGRLICDVSTGMKKNVPIMVMTLTVRGAPGEESITSALSFLENGRELLGATFDKITTSYAHKRWGKK